MDISLILGRILGIYLIILALAMFMNPKGFRQMTREVSENSASMTLAGVITLLVGIILVVIHNDWRLQWTILITIIAWIILIKGATRLFTPRVTQKCTLMLSNNATHFIMALLSLFAGIYFIYFSFVAV